MQWSTVAATLNRGPAECGAAGVAQHPSCPLWNPPGAPLRDPYFVAALDQKRGADLASAKGDV